MGVITDEQLALKLQGGDRGALAPLVERHYDPMLGYLYRLMGGDRALAEDLVQEAFLRALRSIHQYKRDYRFKPWLYAIATNLARNHYNRAETRYTQSIEEEFTSIDEVTPVISYDESPEGMLVELDETRAVLAALAALPAHQREVVALYYYQSLSLQEIADALHIPLGTVKSRLSLAVRRLREIMKDEEDDGKARAPRYA